MVNQNIAIEKSKLSQEYHFVEIWKEPMWPENFRSISSLVPLYNATFTPWLINFQLNNFTLSYETLAKTAYWTAYVNNYLH